MQPPQATWSLGQTNIQDEMQNLARQHQSPAKQEFVSIDPDARFGRESSPFGGARKNESELRKTIEEADFRPVGFTNT